MASETGSISSSGDAAPDLHGLAVLVVDDLELDRKLLRVFLTVEGCDVRTAESAPEAQAMLDSFPARLVLTDLRMPNGDGAQLARNLKRGAATKHIVVVMVTALPGEAAARAARCDGFICKPINLEALAGQLRSFVAGAVGGGHAKAQQSASRR